MIGIMIDQIILLNVLSFLIWKISNVYDYKLDSETETCIIGGINVNNLSDKILNKFDLIAMSSAIRNIPDIIKINKLYKKFCNE